MKSESLVLVVSALSLAACVTPEAEAPREQWYPIAQAQPRPLTQALATCEPRAELARQRAEASERSIQSMDRASQSGRASAGASFATGFLNTQAVTISGTRAYDASVNECMATHGWVKG